MTAPTVAAPTAEQLAARIDRAHEDAVRVATRANAAQYGSTAFHEAMAEYGQIYRQLLDDVAALVAMAEGVAR